MGWTVFPGFMEYHHHLSYLSLHTYYPYRSTRLSAFRGGTSAVFGFFVSLLLRNTSLLHVFLVEAFIIVHSKPQPLAT